MQEKFFRLAATPKACAGMTFALAQGKRLNGVAQPAIDTRDQFRARLRIKMIRLWDGRHARTAAKVGKRLGRPAKSHVVGGFDLPERDKRPAPDAGDEAQVVVAFVRPILLDIARCRDDEGQW